MPSSFGGRYQAWSYERSKFSRVSPPAVNRSAGPAHPDDHLRRVNYIRYTHPVASLLEEALKIRTYIYFKNRKLCLDGPYAELLKTTSGARLLRRFIIQRVIPAEGCFLRDVLWLLLLFVRFYTQKQKPQGYSEGYYTLNLSAHPQRVSQDTPTTANPEVSDRRT